MKCGDCDGQIMTLLGGLRWCRRCGTLQVGPVVSYVPEWTDLENLSQVLRILGETEVSIAKALDILAGTPIEDGRPRLSVEAMAALVQSLRTVADELQGISGPQNPGGGL